MLPKISNILYVSNDTGDFLERLTLETQELSGKLFYADQISLKLAEATALVKEPDNENAFLRKAQKWGKDIRLELVEQHIFFKSVLRRKDAHSLLSKMNRTMLEGKSINSIHDLMGIEYVTLTTTENDTCESIRQLYLTTNIILDYFSDSSRSGERFMICDASPLKNVYSLEQMVNERSEILSYFKEMNPHVYIPKKSGLSPKYVEFVKDYYRQPKIDSCYQGLQFVVKTEKGGYFEIQVKTQPVFDYKNMESSPANHIVYRSKQQKKKTNCLAKEIPLFDLNFDPKKVKNIPGFRGDPNRDQSGILSPIRWDLRKNTHY